MTALEKVRPFVVGAGAAGGLVFLFDPMRGRTRRALVRDQLTRLRHEAVDAVEVAWRDFRNRAVGVAAETRKQVTAGAPDGSDEAVTQRVRAEIGRVSSHPRAIDVGVQDGMVTLRGAVLAAEADAVRAAARGARGAKGLGDELQVHATPAGVPSLQGAGRRPADRLTPAARGALALGALTAATPLVARLAASGRLASLAPLLGASVLALVACGVARQEIEANRVAARRAAGEGV